VGFVAVASLLGGDATNGKIANGHFFLANHGKLTEVSEGVFRYSLWHARSLFITHPLAMASDDGLWWLARRRHTKETAEEP
jgi:hypothetical protein